NSRASIHNLQNESHPLPCRQSRATRQPKQRRISLSEDALIAREQRGNVAILTMQYRPYNLLGPKLINAIVDAIEAAQKAASRAIVIRSGLRHFSAGADLDIFETRVAAGSGTQSNEGRRLIGVDFLRFMELLPIPLIASVHGVCLGGGLEL